MVVVGLAAGLAVLIANNQTATIPESSLPLVTLVSPSSGAPIAPGPSASSRPAADTTELTAQVAITGEALPDFDSTAATDPALGLAIPEVVGIDFDGEPISITANGKPKLLIFLAHWCPHCQAEVPRIQAWIDQNGMPEFMEIISIATAINAERPNYPARDWLEREGWSVPVLIDDSNLATLRAYGMGSFPAFVLVGADGAVLHRAVGEGAIDLTAVTTSLQTK